MTYILPGSAGDLDEDDAPGEAGTDAFNNLLKKQRTLLDERDALISQPEDYAGLRFS
jgi:hypothetical protein